MTDRKGAESDLWNALIALHKSEVVLVTRLVDQLEGTIDLKRKTGTEFVISFPEKKGGKL